MRKFGLIVQVISEYPDQKTNFKFFCSFEQPRFLISKKLVPIMVLTIHMINKIRKDREKNRFLDFGDGFGNHQNMQKTSIA